MLIQAYLMFEGRCEEAIAFYQETLGAEVEAVLRYGDNPDKAGCPAELKDADDKIMHSCLRIGETRIMASDGMCSGAPQFDGFALTISAPDVEKATTIFDALADGGVVQMPLGETFFSPQFGMVNDRFGVHWMVLVAAEQPAA